MRGFHQLALLFSLLFQSGAEAGTLYSTDFSSSLSPFSSCNLKSPSSVTISDSTLEIYFSEADFDGTRNDKGAEICFFQSGTSTNVPQMQKEGWQGFSLYVPSADFPTDKSTIIAQQFCPGGCSSWCAAVQIQDNSLAVEHRSACGDATEETVVADIARDTWHDVVVHMRVSQEENGVYEVWWNGEKVYGVDGIDVGFGSWDGDVLETGWYFKNGQYAYDTESYTDESRTLFFDNVAWYEPDAGEDDGYDTVAP
ncbi:polysaccharide lyase-domain-containing protein [Aspergillus crustosus]